MKPDDVFFLVSLASGFCLIVGFAAGFFCGMHVADDDGSSE